MAKNFGDTFNSNKIYFAIIFLLLGVVFVDIYGVIIKSLGTRYPMAQLTMFRNSFAILSLFILIYFQEKVFEFF